MAAIRGAGTSRRAKQPLARPVLHSTDQAATRVVEEALVAVARRQHVDVHARVEGQIREARFDAHASG